MSKAIAQVVIGLPVEGPFDYLIPKEMRNQIAVGHRVSVPFGRRECAGYVVGLLTRSSLKALKEIRQILGVDPIFDKNALEFARQFSQYYSCCLGEALEMMLPSALRKKRKVPDRFPLLKQAKPKSKGEIKLFHVTGGEGHWENLRSRIQVCLDEGRGALVLVPEIVFIKEVKEKLGSAPGLEAVILDKKMTAKNELQKWVDVRSGKAEFVIGTRSAAFAPVQNLGLMIVLDEDNSSFKQEQSPFYHVREVAGMRQRLEHCDLIFVSPSPSAELWHQLNGRKKAVEVYSKASEALFQLIDLSNYKSAGYARLSYPLQTIIREGLNEKKKIVLFFNRRGLSTQTACSQCGFVIQCERCNTRLSYISSHKKLVCHLCAGESELPKVCPQCQSAYLLSTGLGIEKIEGELVRYYPEAEIRRYDRETAAIPHGADIIIATQAVMSVLKQIKPDVVGFLDIDSQLNRMDYRSAQQVFSLLIRAKLSAKQKVVVQTYQRDNYCLKAVMKMDFEKFYAEELRFRKECQLPPFAHLIALTFRGKDEKKVFSSACQLFQKLTSAQSSCIEVVQELQPDSQPKLRDQFRFIILLKTQSVPEAVVFLRTLLKGFKKKAHCILTINVDP